MGHWFSRGSWNQSVDRGPPVQETPETLKPPLETSVAPLVAIGACRRLLAWRGFLQRELLTTLSLKE